MKNKIFFSIIGMGVLCVSAFLGCATNPSVQRLQTDPRFQGAARQLATAYLDAQKKGDAGTPFGPGAASFYNLSEYKIVSFGWQWGAPAVFIRVKAGNKGGGNPVWENYAIEFSHDPKLESSGDLYLGLRIRLVGPSLINF